MRYLVIFLMSLLLVACNHEDDQISSRPLDVTNASTLIINVDRYYSQFTYGETLRMYHFTVQNAVLILRFPNNDADFELGHTASSSMNIRDFVYPAHGCVSEVTASPVSSASCVAISR